MISKKKNTGQTPAERPGGEPSVALKIANMYFSWMLVIVVGAVCAVGYIFVLDEKVAEVQSAAQDSLPAKIKIRDDLQSIKAELDAAINDYEKIKISKKDSIAKITALLPSDSEYGDLYAHIDSITAMSGLTLTSISIALPADAPKQRVAAASDTSDPVATGQVKTLSLRIAVEGGTYETFKKYLENLERSVRLFDVRSISFNGAQFIPGIDGTQLTPQFAIELTTYYQP